MLRLSLVLSCSLWVLAAPGCSPEFDDPFAPSDDDATTPGDDDTVDDDAADLVAPTGTTPEGLPGDDDSGSEVPDDPCGVVYQPVNGLSGDTPEVAVMDSHRTGHAPEPLRVHTGFHDDAGTSLTVAWETDPDTWASLITWGIASPSENSRGGYAYPVGDPAHPDYLMHEARLCGLTPGETYRIKVGSHAAWSAPILFTTFDPEAEELSLAVTGDSRGGEHIMVDVLSVLMDRAPQAVLHTGDFVNFGTDISGWRAFHDAYTSAIGPRLPMIPVHGNHEAHAEEYYASVIGGGNEGWYSLDLGPLHLAVLDDTQSMSTLEEEALWLDEDLSLATSPFKAVAMHQPLYSAGSHGDSANMQVLFQDIFDEHQVDLVLAGHDHGYSRSWPLRGGVVQDNPEDGTTYVVTGGGGAYLYNFTPNDRTAFAEAVNHAVHIGITGGVLTMQALIKDGIVIDEIQIDRSGP